MEYEDVERSFERMKSNNPRKAAELAFAIATLAMNAGDIEKAKEFGRKSVALFEQANPQTRDECIAMHTEINGAPLPEMIHANVVRDRLRSLQL